MPKIHSFLKQCLCNLRFFKTKYFSRNLSISCGIQVPCVDKLMILHNTFLKMNGLKKIDRSHDRRNIFNVTNALERGDKLLSSFFAIARKDLSINFMTFHFCRNCNWSGWKSFYSRWNQHSPGWWKRLYFYPCGTSTSPQFSLETYALWRPPQFGLWGPTELAFRIGHFTIGRNLTFHWR